MGVIMDKMEVYGKNWYFKSWSVAAAHMKRHPEVEQKNQADCQRQPHTH